MKGLRNILRVSWTAEKTIEWVLNKAGVKRELIDTVKARKLAYYGHTMRKLEGKYSLESTDPRVSEIRAPRQLTIALKLSYYLFIIAKLFKVKDGCLKFVYIGKKSPVYGVFGQ